MRIVLAPVFASMVPLFAGCGTSAERGFEPPALRITAVTPGAISLRVINPNTVPLAVRSFRPHLLSRR